MSLTGGLDTRRSWPGKASLQDAPCYTFGGSYRRLSRRSVARQVARACGQSHKVIPVGEEFLRGFPTMRSARCISPTDARSEPLPRPLRQRAGSPDCSRADDGKLSAIRSSVTSPCSGLAAPTAGLYSSRVFHSALLQPRNVCPITQGHSLTFAAFRQAPWHYHGLLALESSQLSMRTPYVDNELVRTLFRAPARTLANNDFTGTADRGWQR